VKKMSIGRSPRTVLGFTAFTVSAVALVVGLHGSPLRIAVAAVWVVGACVVARATYRAR
jgi:hypothetical protein